MDEALVDDGRVLRLVTRGRTSGQDRTVAVGFVGEPDGSVLIAARSDTTAWARNLLADPRCRVEVSGRRYDALAEPLDRDDHIRAIRALILRYGTPSEELGRGPSFRLRQLVRD
jgi:deazaflavin-dependent oxidoreductase (nitroreductase family)